MREEKKGLGFFLCKGAGWGKHCSNESFVEGILCELSGSGDGWQGLFMILKSLSSASPKSGEFCSVWKAGNKRDCPALLW